MTDLEKAWHPWTGQFRLAHCFQSGMNELNALFPNRPQGAQEGTVGDLAHQAEGTGSDHNPNAAGVVRAWDIQVVDAPFDGQVLANYLAMGMRNGTLPFFGRGGSNRGYVIYNRQITAWDPWGVWQPYNGSDPHDRHIHVSAGSWPGEYDNTQSWNLAAAFGKTPVPVEPAKPKVKVDEEVFIVTPGKTPKPLLVTGGRAVLITNGHTWGNFAAHGIITYQIDPAEYARFEQLQANVATRVVVVKK